MHVAYETLAMPGFLFCLGRNQGTTKSKGPNLALLALYFYLDLLRKSDAESFIADPLLAYSFTTHGRTAP